MLHTYAYSSKYTQDKYLGWILKLTHKDTHTYSHQTHKIHWDFVIQTDHLISARQPDIVIVNKKRKLAVVADPKIRLKES